MISHCTIQAGICGFGVEAKATCDDGQHVTLTVATDCQNIRRIADALEDNMPLDAYAEIVAESSVLLPENPTPPSPCCRGCVVPMALYRCVQVAAGLALPAPVHIDLRTE